MTGTQARETAADRVRLWAQELLEERLPHRPGNRAGACARRALQAGAAPAPVARLLSGPLPACARGLPHGARRARRNPRLLPTLARASRDERPWRACAH